jgi:hypothetical protein
MGSADNGIKFKAFCTGTEQRYRTITNNAAISDSKMISQPYRKKTHQPAANH